MDDRVVNMGTGPPKPSRVGYANSDPWYDGRAHGDTIVDSPRSGTLLTAEEIEQILVRFGGRWGEIVPLELPGETRAVTLPTAADVRGSALWSEPGGAGMAPIRTLNGPICS